MVDAGKPQVVIVGGGFAGLSCAQALGKSGEFDVLLVDRRNHHLFQPLLYQVAMAGLSPAEIAAPIRSLLRRYRRLRVLQARVEGVDTEKRQVQTSRGLHGYDYLLLAAGAQHAYFGRPEWETYAPGLKTLEQATEIRRRVLSAFERAESEPEPSRRKAELTFVVIGGGPTGVELAGALGEMSRFTLARDYRNIDPTLARVVLIEAGSRILPSFRPALAARATRDLERLGVQVWVNSRVSQVDEEGVEVGAERIEARTAVWAAGVEASPLGQQLGANLDRQGRVMVNPDLRVAGQERVFVAGDQAHCAGVGGRPLPGVATVALQQGRFVAGAIARAARGKPTGEFRYWDKGQLATIGRSRALLQSGRLSLAGFPAWVAWLVVHIYYLSSFRHRLLVVFQWVWSYASFSRGARLIVDKNWHSHLAAAAAPPAEATSKYDAH